MRQINRVIALAVVFFSFLGIGMVASAEEGGGNRLFVFDPQQRMWFAYEDGQLVNQGVASGGSNYCRDLGHRCHTPVGTFHVYSKGSEDCRSTKFPIPYGGAPMPYCMYFSGGFAIHGSYEMRDYNASHGCIRVEPSAAEWLSQNFIRYGTTVVVKPY